MQKPSGGHRPSGGTHWLPCETGAERKKQVRGFRQQCCNGFGNCWGGANRSRWRGKTRGGGKKKSIIKVLLGGGPGSEGWREGMCAEKIPCWVWCKEGGTGDALSWLDGGEERIDVDVFGGGGSGTSHKHKKVPKTSGILE